MVPTVVDYWKNTEPHFFISSLFSISPIFHTVGANEDNSTKDEKVVLSACGDIDSDGDDEDEQEEMFVEAHESFEHKMVEWGGPRRGGRLPEPTRFGDWERKGRCSDF